MKITCITLWHKSLPLGKPDVVYSNLFLLQTQVNVVPLRAEDLLGRLSSALLAYLATP